MKYFLSYKNVMKNLNSRVNEIRLNTFGTPMKIIKYNRARDILIEFQDKYKYKVKSEYSCFKKGNIKNPYDKELCNIGYLGEGLYKTLEDKKYTCQYSSWSTMIKRCYNFKRTNLFPTYQECFVCDEWHNYQNFAKWYDNNYYQVSNEIMCLDKDILFKGNKIYSPNNCVFVPHNINALFLKSNASRGKYPIGVSFNKRIGKYAAYCNKNSKLKHLGYFINEKDAFIAYKTFKESLIKNVAEYYKLQIPQKLYDAMQNYQVEITD